MAAPALVSGHPPSVHSLQSPAIAAAWDTHRLNGLRDALADTRISLDAFSALEEVLLQLPNATCPLMLTSGPLCSLLKALRQATERNLTRCESLTSLTPSA